MAVIKFSARPVGYKLGVVFLLVGFMLYIIGFSSTHWASYTFWVIFHTWSHKYVTCSEGIWDTADSDLGGPCEIKEGWTDSRLSQDWMRAVQTLQCVGFACLLAASVYAMIVNLTQCRQRCYRFQEVTTALACFLGFTGVVVYVSQISASLDSIQGERQSRYTTHVLKYRFSWGLGLNTAGCVLTLMSASLIFIYNQAPSSASPRRSEPCIGFGHYNPTGLEGGGGEGGRGGRGGRGDRVYYLPGLPVLPPAYYPALTPPSYYPEGSSPEQTFDSVPPPEYNADCANPAVQGEESPPEYVLGDDDKARIL